jgi:hypothetical protein
MHPIYIFDGLDRYLLVPAGSDLARAHGPVAPTRARAILEAALRRRDPRLMRGLRAVLRVHSGDSAIASRQLELLRTTGTVGGNLVLVRERAASVPRLDPPAPLMSLPPREPEPPEPISEEQPEDEPPPAKTSIRVSLFFDGTGNNRTNTRARPYTDMKGSYLNDYTNIALLETRYLGDDSFAHAFSIYVEGIGTTNYDSDTTEGLALGTGATGVPAKVRKGVDQLLRSIRELGIARGVIIERIHLDAFGFSRGAAAARYFVHYILTENPLKPRIEAGGHPVTELKVNFIGLFDTVASYGVFHYNDTSDLSLDAIRVAMKVVHLAAAEEHRANFRLTNIASAIAAGVGIEIYFPGVHSDVGGSYTDYYNEVDLQIMNFGIWDPPLWGLDERCEQQTEWLIETGWYHREEIQEVDWLNRLKVTKRWIRNFYRRIPLQHMANFATESGLTFDAIADHYPVPNGLAAIRDIIDAHVAAHRGGGSTAEHWINMRGPFKQLRHDHLHWSANYGEWGGANDPQWSNGDPMTGTRKRIVQAG